MALSGCRPTRPRPAPCTADLDRSAVGPMRAPLAVGDQPRSPRPGGTTCAAPSTTTSDRSKPSTATAPCSYRPPFRHNRPRNTRTADATHAPAPEAPLPQPNRRYDKQHPIRINRLFAAAVLAVTVSTTLPSVANAGPPAPTVPSAIQVPDGNKVFLVGQATGAQIFTCQATTGGFGWRFIAPRADLYDEHGNQIAIHFAGPTWQASDGSLAVGQRVDGVTVDATAIPWLLLAASPAPGPDGDRLADTTFIQRVATTGGLMPAAADCDEDAAGTTQEVPYTADYYFWKATGN